MGGWYSLKGHQMGFHKRPTGILGSFGFSVLFLVLTATSSLALSGDPIADRVLGQNTFTKAQANFVDGGGVFQPESVAIDRSVTPNRIYVADTQNSRVLGWTSTASFVNGAPANLVIGQPDFFSSTPNNGGASATSLNYPAGVGVDSNGNLYVADTLNSRVLEYDSPFTTDTTADRVFGQNGGFTTGGCNLGVPSSPAANSLCDPNRVAIDPAGRLYIADTANDRVLEYGSPMTSATPTGVFGQSSFVSSGCNPAISANALCRPMGMALDSGGRLYVADYDHNRVLRYDTPLTNSTANQVYGQLGSFSSNYCNNNNTGTSATGLCLPTDVTVDAAGYLYVVDENNCRVLEFDSPLTNTTANQSLGQNGSLNSGSTCVSYYNQPSASNLMQPFGAAVDDEGRLYVADSGYNRVVEYDNPLLKGTAATHVLGQPDLIKDRSNRVDQIGLNQPQGVAIDASITPNRVYIADTSNSRVLGWYSAAAFISGAPASILIGQPDFGSYLCAQAGQISAKTLCYPTGVAVDGAGNLYVADQRDDRVLEYNAPVTSGAAANLVFGQGGSFTTSGCASVTANSLCKPSAVAVDSGGNVYIADHDNGRVLKYSAPLATGTTADVVIGQPSFTVSGCTGTAVTSTCTPEALAVDSNGNLYVADLAANRVVEFNAPLTNNAAANHVFGQGGSFISAGCNQMGPGPDSLCEPWGVALDQAGNLYVSDWANARVLEYNTPLTTDTTADNVFGQAGSFTSASCNRFGISAASLCEPVGVAADASGNIFVVDGNNNRMVEYDAPLGSLVAAKTATPVKTSTAAATSTPTPAPTKTSTPAPSTTPTAAPTKTSTPAPTKTPTPAPSKTPTAAPTKTSTPAPTKTPTPAPTKTSTAAPTKTSTAAPTKTPTPAPSTTPTAAPTKTSTAASSKTSTPAPTKTPTAAPSKTPTPAPSKTATAAPSKTATAAPSKTATPAPPRRRRLIPPRLRRLLLQERPRLRRNPRSSRRRNGATHTD